LYGGLRFPNDENMGINHSIANTILLSQNNVNNDGNWEIMPRIRAVDTDTATDIASLRFHYREIL